jgi:hypothetical protein
MTPMVGNFIEKTRICPCLGDQLPDFICIKHEKTPNSSVVVERDEPLTFSNRSSLNSEVHFLLFWTRDLNVYVELLA